VASMEEHFVFAINDKKTRNSKRWLNLTLPKQSLDDFGKVLIYYLKILLTGDVVPEYMSHVC
jgi:hypothetical protein